MQGLAAAQKFRVQYLTYPEIIHKKEHVSRGMNNTGVRKRIDWNFPKQINKWREEGGTRTKVPDRIRPD